MPMQYGTVPGIEKRVSRLVQGTVPLSSEREQESFALLDETFQQGCRTYDAAHNYGDGDCETMLGRWMKSRGVRDEIVILGKGAHPSNGMDRVTPEDITSDLHESLQRQQVDYIDLYVLHRDNPALPVGPIVEILNEHKRAGKICAFGGSNWSADRIRQANEYAAAHGLDAFTLSSPNFSLAVQIQPPWKGCLSISGEAGEKDRAWYRENNIPIFPWSSLAGGFFSGRFERDNLDQFTGYLDTLCVTSYCSEDNFQRLDRVKVAAAKYGMTIPQVAMAYIMSQPQEVFALVGCRTGAEYAENAAALEHHLSDAELAWLDLRSDDRPW
jgi:aryl-alcohol dehydrogenase-like predicted oxidoreductase